MASSNTTIRILFSELRRSLGHSVSTVEILQFATAVQRFFESKRRNRFIYEINPSDELDASFCHFEELPIDIAMRDGGWRILEYELGANPVDSYHYGNLIVSEQNASYQFAFSLNIADRTEPEPLSWIDKQLRQNKIIENIFVDYIFENWEIEFHE